MGDESDGNGNSGEAVIAIVNYGSGNVQAISNIYQRMGVPFLITRRPEDLSAADRIVLPGVGAFDQAMSELARSGMQSALNTAVLQDAKPLLGICVGMQLFAKSSEEGTAQGLGWVDGVVKRFDQSSFEPRLGLPHMGWNTVEPMRSSPLFAGVNLESEFYFLHSYYFQCDRSGDRLGVTPYGISFASVIQKDNIYGVQFHPEKSHDSGVQLLTNFARMQ